MVASGYVTDNTRPGFIHKIEVIDLLNSSRTCKEWADLPDDLGRVYAFGGFVEAGLLMCCGIEKFPGNSVPDCLHITDINTVRTNISFEVGVEGIEYPGSVVLDNNNLLLVTGGLCKISIFFCKLS